jgi:hypothetical protein
MITKAILWSMLILPWLSLLLMKRDGLKRYTPVAVFTALLVTITYEIAYVYEWWVIDTSIVPWGNITNLPNAYGLFFVGTLWIFYLTYRHFGLYLLVNTAFNWVFAFPAMAFFDAVGIKHYVNMTPWVLWAIGVVQSLVIYGYQKWQEDIFVKPKDISGREWERKESFFGQTKEKAK